MKGLWIGITALLVIGGAGAGWKALSGGERQVVPRPGASQASLPVQGSSFDSPAAPKAATATAAATEPGSSLAAPAPISTPAPVSAPAPAQEDAGADLSSATPAPALASAAGAAVPPAGADGYIPLTFDTLTSYKYQEPKPPLGAKPGTPPPTPIPNQIPQNVIALNNRKITLEGYMVPMEVTDEGKVKTFILAKDQPQCCFGDMQAANEWVDVRMAPDTYTDFMLDRPVKIQGTFEVGEKLEDGFLVSLYRMTADKVID